MMMMTKNLLSTTHNCFALPEFVRLFRNTGLTQNCKSFHVVNNGLITYGILLLEVPFTRLIECNNTLYTTTDYNIAVAVNILRLL